VIQLFGKFPEKFAKAAEWIDKNLKPDGIDINMGCPARKVVGSDHGVALLKNPALAIEIVKAVKDNTNLPVSVKTRLGWEKDDEILQFAPLLADAGIDAIIIHGRTYRDGFKGLARWENIYKIKEMLGNRVVVIGNGDIQNSSQFSVLSSQSETMLDGVAIGRASFGKPWVFGGIKGEKLKAKSLKLKEVILEHAKLAYETKGEKGIVEFRKHMLAYIKGFSNAKKLRMEVVKIQNIADIKIVLSLLDC
jgi:nifR3 family TIM-barrel protein